MDHILHAMCDNYCLFAPVRVSAMMGSAAQQGYSLVNLRRNAKGVAKIVLSKSLSGIIVGPDLHNTILLACRA